MKTVLLCALALVLSTQVYAQQWEKIQYPEIYYTSNKTNLRKPRLIVHNNIIYALPSQSLPLYTSQDNGGTWQMCDTNALRNLGLLRDGSLDWSIGRIDFTKSGAFASISTYNGKKSRTYLGRSLDNGQTWQFIDLSIISQNAIDSNIYNVTADNETVIVSTGGSGNTNLFISTDEGTTWKEMGLPKNIVSPNGEIALFQNSLMYDGQFYDGKELSNKGYQGRFYLIQDINNPISQKLSDFPKWADHANKDEYYLTCDRLGVTGDFFTCDGYLSYINNTWGYKSDRLPFTQELMNYIDDDTLLRFSIDNFGAYYDTPGNVYFTMSVRRLSDSARVHRYVKLSYPYSGNFEVLADDFIASQNFDGTAASLLAVTDNALLVRTNKSELYRFQKSSVSVEEEIQNANNTMTLQPHPAKDQINIRFTTPQNGLYHCELHDMMGAKIVSLGAAPLQQGQQWNLDADIHSVPNGYYRVIIKSPTQVYSLPCLIHK